MLDDDATADAARRSWVGQPPLPSAAPGLYAGVVVRRCLAYLVDIILMAILGACLGFVLSIVGFLTFGLLSPLSIAFLTLWPLLYQSAFIAVRGATPGMRLFDLELKDWSGTAVEPVQAVLFVILFYVTVWLTAWLILLVVLFTDRNRALHDILANTLVIRSQR